MSGFTPAQPDRDGLGLTFWVVAALLASCLIGLAWLWILDRPSEPAGTRTLHHAYVPPPGPGEREMATLETTEGARP